MPGIADLASMLKGAAKDGVETFARNAESGTEKNAEGVLNRQGANAFDNARMTYHETMLKEGAGTARRAMGYGAPAALSAGMAYGSYEQAQDGNTTGAAILGAGSAVMGGALALAHFGGVAEHGVEQTVAKKAAAGLQVAEQPAAAIGKNDAAAAHGVVQNSNAKQTPLAARAESAFADDPLPTQAQMNQNRTDAMKQVRSETDRSMKRERNETDPTTYTSHKEDDESDAALANARALSLSETTQARTSAMDAHMENVNKRVAESTVQANTVPARPQSPLANIPGLNKAPAVSSEDMAGMNSRMAGVLDLAAAHNNSGLAAANTRTEAVRDEAVRTQNTIPNLIRSQFPSGVY